MKKLIIIFLLLPVFANISNSQVTVYPSLVFVDPISRSGYIRVVNNSDVPMEIEIVSAFSYKNGDSANSIKTQIDSIMESKHSLEKYLKIFPKRLVVQGKKDQMVRFLVMHPPDILDGTYVSNITFISQPLQKQIDTTDTKNITMGLILKTGIISMVIYQKGKLTTSLDFSDVKTELDTANLNLTFNFEKDGNSPYWGKAKISIFDIKGMEIDTLSEPFGVYCSTKKTFHMKKDKFKTGNYKAEITINTIRADIPEERTIKVVPITKRFEFTLP